MVGIVYKTQPYQESNRMLFVYTPKGKKTLIARGSQRLSSNLRIISQYLTELEFLDNGKSMQPLIDAVLINDFNDIKQDYFKAKEVAVMLEAIDKVRDEELEHNYLYQELISSINSKHLKEATLSFLIKLASKAGYQPNLDADGRKVVGFNLEYATLVYENEAKIIDLKVKHVVILLKLLNLDVSKIEELEIDDYQIIKNFIKKYYEYHLRVSLKNI